MRVSRRSLFGFLPAVAAGAVGAMLPGVAGAMPVPVDPREQHPLMMATAAGDVARVPEASGFQIQAWLDEARRAREMPVLPSHRIELMRASLEHLKAGTITLDEARRYWDDHLHTSTGNRADLGLDGAGFAINQFVRPGGDAISARLRESPEYQRWLEAVQMNYSVRDAYPPQAMRRGDDGTA